jgi:hypothetical protein
MQVEVRGVRTGFEARTGVAAIAYRCFSTKEEAGAYAPTRAMRCNIERRNSVLIHFDPPDGDPLNSDPYVVMQYRPRNAICRRMIRPLRSLRRRHRWHGQFEDGATPNRGQRHVVTGVGAPNFDHAVT